MIQLLVAEPLPRAGALPHDQWRAIEDAYGRLASALATDDRPLIVGSSKELVECVARVTLVAYGRVVADEDEYTKVLASAHQIVEHAMGPDIPGNHPLRQIPQYAKKMALQLRELRNGYGTGHGRATVHDITDEVIDASVHAALVWVRWALTRLQAVLLGALRPLVDDLRHGTFSTGDLAARLEAANILRLSTPEQSRLGVAVGQRAANETFIVRFEGIRACTDDPQRWPDAYREGVVQGLFVNEDGQAHAYAAASADCTAELLQHHIAPEEVLTTLSSVLESASWSLRFQRHHHKIITSMKEALRKMPEAARPAWSAIIAGLEARAPDGIR